MSDTIYAVTTGSYSDYHVLALFNNEADAETYADHHPDSEIEEFPLNPVVPEHPPGLYAWRVGYVVATEVHNACRTSPNPAASLKIQHNQYPKSPQYNSYSLYVWARDEEHALKIFSEKKRQFIAENT